MYIRRVNMEILSREVSVQNDKYIVVEQIKKTYTRAESLNEIQNIQRLKENIIEQSKRLKLEYDSLQSKEIELQELLGSEEFEEIIK